MRCKTIEDCGTISCKNPPSVKSSHSNGKDSKSNENNNNNENHINLNNNNSISNDYN